MATNRFKRANAQESPSIVEDFQEVEDTSSEGTKVQEPASEDVTVDETKEMTTEVESEVTAEMDNTESEEVSETAPPEIIFNSAPTNVKPVAEKNVKVCLTRNHSCSIGGVRYHFTAGKQVSVPVNVKSILKQANLLMPL